MFKKYIPLLFLIGLFYASCTDSTSLDNINSVVNLGAAPAITGPSSNTTFVTYEAQIDLVGNDFSSPISLGQINGLAMNNLTVGGLNSLLFAQGLPELEALDMEVRIIATVSDEVEPLISEPLPMTLTLYDLLK